jgi:hypothetical protein
MPRKQKIPVRPMEDAMKGVGAIPTQELVEHSRSYGGTICSICRHHIDIIDDDDRSQSDIEDKIEGGGYLSKAAEKVEKVSRKSASKVKKAGKATGKYVTSTQADSGLSSDLLTYGLPAVGSASLGALGAATGNPVVGIAASALGSKLGAMAGEQIKSEVLKEGKGIKRKGRFEKGSEAAKEHMRMLREKRLKKLMK